MLDPFYSSPRYAFVAHNIHTIRSMRIQITPDQQFKQNQQQHSPNQKRKINLLRGWPSPSLLIPDKIASKATAVLEPDHGDAGAENATLHIWEPLKSLSRSLEYDDLTVAEQALLYGPDEGHMPLRKALGVWLEEFYGKSTKGRYPGVEASRSDTPAAESEAIAPQSERIEGRTEGFTFQNGTKHISNPHPPEDYITITGGASQSLGVILGAFTDPTYTRAIWIVVPGYYMVFKIFDDAGFGDRMIPVPETPCGPDVNFLRREMQKCEENRAQKDEEDIPKLKPPSRYPKIYKHVIYTVPTFANPSSITTNLKTREELVLAAREFDALIIADDVYDMLQWPAKPFSERTQADAESEAEAEAEVEPAFDFTHATLPRLVDVDRYLPGHYSSISEPESHYGNVISNGSFSKICGPGARVGWIQATTPQMAFAVSQSGIQKSGGSPSQLVSTFMTLLLNPQEHKSSDLTSHIRYLCESYWKRWSCLVAAVNRILIPLGVTIHKSAGIEANVSGGFFVWIHLPSILTESAQGEVSQAEPSQADSLQADSFQADSLQERPARATPSSFPSLADLVAARCLSEENLIVASGSTFQIPGRAYPSMQIDGCLRLSFAWEAERELVEGVERLGRVLRRMMEKSE